MKVPFYVEINSEKVNRKVVPLEEVPKLVPVYARHRNTLFMSYYLFDNEINDHYSRGVKTIRGFRGNVYFRKLIVDIDKGKDTSEFVLRRAREFCYRMNSDYDIPYESIEYYFSGSGYHIALPQLFKFNPSNSLPILVSQNFGRLFPEGDKAVWSSFASMIRVPNTFNEKVGLFKIPLTQDEFFNGNTEDFNRIAKEPRLNFKWNLEPFEKDFTHLIEEIPIKLSSIPSNENKDQSTIATCITNMYREGAEAGTRHHKILRMSSAWRRAGLPREAVAKLLIDWADSLEPYEVKRIVDDTYDKGYTYSCADYLMSKYCSDKCIFYRKKNYTLDLITPADAEKDFVNFIRSDFESKSFDLNEAFPGKYVYKFYPGEVFGIQGPTKIGKSGFIQNLLVKLTRMKSIYCTFENHKNLAYRRFIQIAHGMTKKQVEEYYKQSNNSLSDKIKHIQMLVIPPTIEQFEKMIIDNQPQIVIVDTLDGLDVPGVTDITAKTSILANRLKEVAQRTDCIIGCILHISKQASSPNWKGEVKRLDVHSSIGSSAIAQKFDKILSWEGERESVYRTLTASASRDEAEITLNLRFNKHNFRMETI
jgi:hypothetical protein